MFLPLLMAVAQNSFDIRGPILTGSKPPIVGRQYVQAGQAPVAIHPDDKGPGVGKWIWLPSPQTAFAVRFRKSVALSEAPKLVRSWVTAEVRYRMWINGRLAARGPADAGRDYDSGPCGPWFEDVRDLTAFFRKGVNTVAVEVFSNPLVSSDASTGHPGLKVDLMFRDESPLVQAIASDAGWKAAPAPDLNQDGAKNGFRIDLNLEQVGWQSSTFDDSRWASAEIATRAERPTAISELAPPLEAELHPTGVTRVSNGVNPHGKQGGAIFSRDGNYTIQYGHILSGYVGLKVRGHKGARLQIMPNEHDAPGWNRQAEILLRDGDQVVDLPYFDSFSVINVKVEGVQSPIEIEDVRCVFTSYPVRYLGDFSCSNEEYNRIWKVCRWVTQICMQTHHLDSPHHQEPISDAGDYLIESLNSLYAFGEGTLARQDLKKIARTLKQRNYQSFHTSYSLLWIQMLMQYLDYTGDTAPVRELAPDVFALMDRFESYIGPHGLISEAPNYMFMDWVEIEGFNLHHPPAVIGQGYMTALYYRALADATRVAQLIGDTEHAAKFEALRASVVKAFNQELWVPEHGLYRDGKPFQTTVTPNQWLPADKQIETYSTQVNALAVACGLVPQVQSQVVMTWLSRRSDLNCQPYFMHFLFEAMDAASRFNDFAEPQLKRWKIVPDTQSFHEMWEVGDLSHAWNATPMFQMSGRILGVVPSAPGFSRFKIRPHPLSLAWAKGKVPTPNGLITVSWKRVQGRIEVRFTVPPGTEAEVGGVRYSPGDHQASLELDLIH